MTEIILIVEDDITLLETLVFILKNQGYQVETAIDGPTAIEKAGAINPDLLLLDIMLPGIDGIEVCRILRKNSNIPILMLTARDDEIDRVVGLEVGADDYLTKPFSMRELLARIKALLRRVRNMKEVTESEVSPHKIFSFDNLSIDETRQEISIEGKPVFFRPKEYDLIIFLANHIGKALSREKILEKVWGWEYFGDSRTVDVHIRWLREKIEKDPAKPKRIVTIRGTGYRFEG